MVDLEFIHLLVNILPLLLRILLIQWNYDWWNGLRFYTWIYNICGDAAIYEVISFLDK